MRTKTILISLILPAVIVIALFWVLSEIKQRDLAYAFEIPQSRLTTDEILQEINDARYGVDMEKIEFLNYDSSDTVNFLNMDGDGYNPELSDEVMTNVLADPDFQRQVGDLKKQIDSANVTLINAEDKKSSLPPLGVLVSLFLMGTLALGGTVSRGTDFASAELGRRLSDFFSFETMKKSVKKIVNVVKKVPVYTTRIMKDIVKKMITVPRTVAYTAYETVKEVSQRVKTWTEEIVQYKPQSQTEKISEIFSFIEKNKGLARPNVQRGIDIQMRYVKMEYDELKRSLNGKLSPSARAMVERGIRSVGEDLNSMAGRIIGEYSHGSTMYEKLRAEYDRDVNGKFLSKITRSVIEPVVNFIQKPFIAYRTEYDTVEKMEIVERTVEEVTYRDVVEQVEVAETVEEKRIVPLKEKIALAMNYVKNLPRIKQNPSNRSFGDALKMFHGNTAFANAFDEWKSVGSQMQQAMHMDNHPSNQPYKDIAVQKYNAFVKKMKALAYGIRTSSDPMTALHGSEYLREIRDLELSIKGNEAKLENLKNLKAQLIEAWPKNSGGLDSARVRYEGISKEMRQINDHLRDSEKSLVKAKADYNRRFAEILDQTDRLAYLKDTKTMVEILEQTNVTFGLGTYSAELAVNGARPVFAGNGSLQTAGFFNWLKDRKQRKIEAKEAEQKRKFLEYDRAKTEAEEAEIKAKEIAKEKAESKMRILDAKKDEPDMAKPEMIQDTKIIQMRISQLEKGPINAKVSGIVLHRTDSSDAESALASFKSGVGTHFLVAKDGTIYQTASLSQYTYHIGKIKSACYEAGNCIEEEAEKIKGYGWNPTAVHKNEYAKDSSKRYPVNEDGIGVEVVGRYYKDNGEWEPLTTEQIPSVTYLVNLLQAKYNLSFSDIYAHEAISHKTKGEGQTVLDAIKGQIKNQ